MKAMILAAGLGTRLRPLSLEIPKPVIPVLGQPLCGHAMSFLREHGAESFLLNLHYGPETVRKKVTAWAAGRFPVEFTHEPEILGTGGGIGNAREYLRGETFVTANSDAVARFPLGDAFALHRANGALATLVLLPDRSKRYIPVLGQPLCGHPMAFLREYGAASFLLNLHHGPETVREKVTAWAADRFPVEFTHEPSILGTGGGIGNAREYLRGETFVTANSDAVARFPLGDALASHRANGALATLVLFPDRSKRYTPVRVRDDGRIAGFGPDAPAGAFEGFYTGYLIAEPELLDRIPRGRASCIVRETMVPLIAAGAPIRAFMTEGGFLDFGTPEDYLRGTLALLAEPDGGKGARSFVHPLATVEKGAFIGPDAVIEEGASVGAGATVRRAILWPGAVVPPGALVENGILTPRGFVPA